MKSFLFSILYIGIACLLFPMSETLGAPGGLCSSPTSNGQGLMDASAPSYGFGLQVTSDRKYPLYAVGEDINLSISVQRAAYISVISIDSDGAMTVVFPNKYQPDGHLDPGASLHIPDPTHYRLTARKPAGCNLIKVVASSASVSAAPVPRSITNADSRLAGSGDWQETTISINIVE